MRCFSAILIGLVAMPSTVLGAQESSALDVGDLVRITAPDYGMDGQLAFFLRLYRDTLTVQADSAVALPLASVTLFEVSRGRSNRPTYVGIAAGAVAGILVGVAVAADEESEVSGGTRSDPFVPPDGASGDRTRSPSVSGAVVAPVAGAFVGSFVGGLVGKQFRRHSWEALPFVGLSVGVGPRRLGTFLLGLSVGF